MAISAIIILQSILTNTSFRSSNAKVCFHAHFSSPYTLVWPPLWSCTRDLHVPRPDTDHRSAPRPPYSTESVSLYAVCTGLHPPPPLRPPPRFPPAAAALETASRGAPSARCPAAHARSTPYSLDGPARAHPGTAEGKPGTECVRRAAGATLHPGSLGTRSHWRVKRADRLTLR